MFSSLFYIPSGCIWKVLKSSFQCILNELSILSVISQKRKPVEKWTLILRWQCWCCYLEVLEPPHSKQRHSRLLFIPCHNPIIQLDKYITVVNVHADPSPTWYYAAEMIRENSAICSARTPDRGLGRALKTHAHAKSQLILHPANRIWKSS